MSRIVVYHHHHHHVTQSSHSINAIGPAPLWSGIVVYAATTPFTYAGQWTGIQHAMGMAEVPGSYNVLATSLTDVLELSPNGTVMTRHHVAADMLAVDVALGNDGSVFVAYFGSGYQLIDGQGNVRKFTSTFSHSTELQTPTSNGWDVLHIAVDRRNGCVLLTDIYVGQVHVYDASGAFLRTIIKEIGPPSGLAVNQLGDIFVVQNATGTLLKYGSNGILLSQLQAAA
jgi:hypothetical protein